MASARPFWFAPGCAARLLSTTTAGSVLPGAGRSSVTGPVCSGFGVLGSGGGSVSGPDGGAGLSAFGAGESALGAGGGEVTSTWRPGWCGAPPVPDISGFGCAGPPATFDGGAGCTAPGARPFSPAAGTPLPDCA
ncbi:hypothetical protein [Amycolatopsis japonica]